jgi:hypothetical protein
MDDLFATLQGATQGGAAPTQAAPSAPAQQASAPSSSGFDPNKSYGTPTKLLDNLTMTESSKNPLAVNKTTGAMGPYQFMPSTLAMMRKQGIKFDPFDPVQARNAADYYIQQLKQQNGGTYQGALKAYGGFVKQDPTQYINKVMQGVGTTPGQSNVDQQAPKDQGPMSDLFSTLQAGPQTQAATPAAAQPAPAPGMPTKPMTPVTASQNGSTWSDVAQKGVGNLAQSVLGIAGAGARLIGANDFANQAQAARAQIEQQMQAGTNNSVAGKVAGVAGAALPYVSLAGASIPGAAAGGAIAGAIPAIADNKSGAETAQEAVLGAGLGAGGALAAKGIGALAKPLGKYVGLGDDTAAAAAPSAGVPPGAAPSGAAAGVAGGRGSVGAAGTNFAQQAAAEGVPDAIVQKIAAAEKSGTINATAAGRHIEAGSLPVPVELTAGQATGDIHLLSNELNSRAKNPEIANRFNAQNGQINDNLTALRDSVSPDVTIPSGAPTGQAIVDAYKEMDAPIRQNISELYAKARGADGAPALVDAAPQMAQFESAIGPTRFKALPAEVKQIFLDAKRNQVTIPDGFDNAGSARPMNVSDLMDIDKTLSGALAGVKDGSVRHDIGMLRDRIVGSDLNPSSAGKDAFQAYKDAQAAARTRFQAMDADPAYKASVGDSANVGEPSSLADDFVKKYVAGGKTANVQNMIQNLSNTPENSQLVASALMDHIRAQAGVDLRTGTGNISQAGLNKAILNQGDKLRLVLGPEASQTLEKLGNVARYTQEQPRGSYVNNSNTAVTLLGHGANIVKSLAERGGNVVVPGAQLGTWGREALANRANAVKVGRSLELGAGLSTKGLDRLR